MATRRTTKKAAAEKEAAPAAPKAAPAPSMKPAELARFLGLGDKVKADDLNSYLQAAMVAADEYISEGTETGHLYSRACCTWLRSSTPQAPLTWKTKRHSSGCRHFFELARRELGPQVTTHRRRRSRPPNTVAIFRTRCALQWWPRSTSS